MHTNSEIHYMHCIWCTNEIKKKAYCLYAHVSLWLFKWSFVMPTALVLLLEEKGMSIYVPDVVLVICVTPIVSDVIFIKIFFFHWMKELVCALRKPFGNLVETWGYFKFPSGSSTETSILISLSIAATSAVHDSKGFPQRTLTET